MQNNRYGTFILVLSFFIAFTHYTFFVDALSAADENEFTDKYSTNRIDIDHDNLYDYLFIEIGMDILVPDDYCFIGKLYDSNNGEITWSLDKKYLPIGYHIICFSFDGKTIRDHGMNGPYYLRNIVLFTGSSDSGLNISRYIPKQYVTPSYNYTDFASDKTTGWL